MSLGGMTTLALADALPELVRAAVLVDVTPGVDAEKSAAITAFVKGPDSLRQLRRHPRPDVEHNPTRTVSSLRRGILHNAVQREDGSWVWRYRPPPRSRAPDGIRPARLLGAVGRGLAGAGAAVARPGHAARSPSSTTKTRPSCFAAARRHASSAIGNAGHSVQGDTPVELAQLINDFAQRR